MYINNKALCQPIIGSSLEKIYELIGREYGNSKGCSLAYLELPPNASTTKHYHPHMVEIYYVLEGSATLILDGEHKNIIKNDAILIRKHSIHQLINHTREFLHLLTISLPAWLPSSEVIVGE